MVMRTTVDIPDVLYRELKVHAANEGCSVREVVLRSVRSELGGRHSARKNTKIKLPLVSSKKPGWLKLTNAEIDEILSS
jgi:hypothetical protein